MLSSIVVIKPGPFSSYQFYKEFRAAADSVTNEWIALFKVTHSTWKEHDPKWNKTIKVSSKEIDFEVMTNDTIYGFLNYGTKERFAVMPFGWASKTAPGRFKPTGGAGRFDPAAPGAWDFRKWKAAQRAIMGRFWDKQVVKKTAKTMPSRFQAAMDIGAQNSGHFFN